MAKVFYEDVFGNRIECDDEITALGPHPDLSGTSAQSPRDLRFQPIRFHSTEQPEMAPKKASGYSNAIDDPQWAAKHWPGNKKV
jgi:excisionase family DNA binding protein